MFMGYASAIVLLASSAGFAAPDWWNRPAVLRAAQSMATEIEHLDERLHDANAPADFIRRVHHLEETVTEFVALVGGNGTYPEAMSEFNHIREDVRMIETEFAKYPGLLNNPAIGREWRATRAAYRRLDHEMLRETLTTQLRALTDGNSISDTAVRACEANKPGLLKLADDVTAKLEVFDESLHDVKAPTKLIQLTHHFEEGLLDFVKALRDGASCRDAIAEFQHFHEDVQLLYKELSARPELFHQAKVLSSWNALLPAFVRLQNRLY